LGVKGLLKKIISKERVKIRAVQEWGRASSLPETSRQPPVLLRVLGIFPKRTVGP